MRNTKAKIISTILIITILISTIQLPLYAITYTDGVNTVGLNTSYEDIIKLLNPVEQAPSKDYESVHITNAPEYLYLGYKYPLDAKPYPHHVLDQATGKTEFYDLRWTSSDESIAYFLDDMLVPVKAGTITATVRIAGTDITSSVQIQIKEKPVIVDKAITLKEDYTSSEGYKFNAEDPAETSRAIFSAITEADKQGYNHIIFPKIDFRIQPIGTTYIIPSGMTVEFPEGSTIYMVESDYAVESKNHNGYCYFSLGYTKGDDSLPKKADGTPDYSATYENAKLVVDKYYGERYQTEHDEAYFTEHCVFACIGRRAQYSVIEIHNADSVGGFFIAIGGGFNIYELKPSFRIGGVYYTDFQKGKLDEKGNLNADENWISSVNYTQIPDQVKAQGRYNIGPYYAGNGYGLSGRLYNIFWYNESKQLIRADYWRHLYDNYDMPEGAAYFRISAQQSDLPTGNFMNTEDYCVVRISEDYSARFCEVKNTHVTNSASGMLSMVGGTDGCWIHDSYTSWNGHKNTWAFDFEDGWYTMRHNIVENNTINGQTGFTGGYHNFIINNKFQDIDTRSGTENNRIIHNLMTNMEMGEHAIAHFYANDFLYWDYSDLIYDKGNTGIVIDYRPANGISIDKNTLTLKEGESESLTATISGHKSYGYKVTNKTILWSSSDTNIATVDSSGNVTAKSPGTATITATAQDNGKTIDCAVTVNGVDDTDITSIEWEQEPIAEETQIEKNAGFKYAGKVKITYKDSYSKTVDVTSESFKISGFNSSTLGEQEVTLTYKDTGFTLKEKVNVYEKPVVVDKQVTAIEWAERPSSESLNIKQNSGYTYSGTAKIIYSDNSQEVINVTKDNFTISGFDSRMPGYQDVTLTYKDTKFTLITRVNVEAQTVEKLATSIAWKEEPRTKSVKIGETFPYEGTATVTYNDGTSEEVQVTSDNFTISNYDSTKEGKQTATLTYQGTKLTINQEITVLPKEEMTGIAIKEKGKIEYIVGETLDISGLEVYAIYDNNTSKKLNNGELKITYDSLNTVTKDTVINKTTEKRTVTVTYNGFSDTYEVSLKGKEYIVTNGGSGNFVKDVNSDLIFKTDATSNFMTVLVNGQQLSENDYKYENGRIILNANYLNTLAEDTYTVEFAFADGISHTTFTIAKSGNTQAPTDSEPDNQNKGDKTDNKDSDKDNTMAIGKLPKAGLGISLSIFIIIAIIGCVYAYFKYNKVRKM